MSSCKLQVWLILVIHRHLRTGPCFCNLFFFSREFFSWKRPEGIFLSNLFLKFFLGG